MEQPPCACYDETGISFFQRLKARRLRSGLSILDDQLGLAPGDVVEFSGQQGTGKSLFLLRMIAACLLPTVWRGIHIGGAGESAVIYDLDYRFDVERLVLVIQHWVGATAHGPTLTAEDMDTIVEECLDRLSVLRCADSLQLLVSLGCLPSLLAQCPSIRLVVFDSFGAPFCEGRAEGASGQRLDATVGRVLRKLASQNLLVLALASPVLPRQQERERLALLGDLVSHRVHLTHDTSAQRFVARAVVRGEAGRSCAYLIREAGVSVVGREW